MSATVLRSPLALGHLAFFGVYLPFRAVRAARRGKSGALPSRVSFFQASVVDLVARGIVSLVVALSLGLNVLPRHTPPLVDWLAGAAAGSVILIIAVPHWRGGVMRGERFSYFAMPTSRHEDAWWTVISLLSGTTEELTWRGVQYQLLAALTGSTAAAAGISAITFGLGHLVQGRWWLVATVGIALIFQGLTWFTGSLYVAMAVHVVVNLIGGFYTAHAARVWGYRQP